MSALSTIAYTYTAGVDLDPGVVVQLDPANDGEVILATDGTLAGAELLAGITQHGAEAGDPIDVIIFGEAWATVGVTLGGAAVQKLTVFGGGVGTGLLGPATVAVDQCIARLVGNVDSFGITAAGMRVKVFVNPAHTA